MTGEYIAMPVTGPIFGEVRGLDMLTVHDRSRCAGEPCTIHNPSDHPMRDFPQLWRADRQIMERTCPHGVGHPDPDDLTVRTTRHGGVHGCDGCCRGVADWNRGRYAS